MNKNRILKYEKKPFKMSKENTVNVTKFNELLIKIDAISDIEICLKKDIFNMSLITFINFSQKLKGFFIIH